MKIFLSIMRPFIAYLALSMGTFFMLTMIIEYSSFRTDIHFLKLKQVYLPITIWRVCFYIHVFSSVLALAAGLTQFSGHIQRKYKKVHRTIGKIYVIVVLLVNFPTALVLAYYANGLLPTKIAFTLLDCLWFFFTFRAYTAIRKKKIIEHKEFMIRSFALTFSAITLRTWNIVLSETFPGTDQLTLYMIDAWMGFVPNLLVAEWLIRRKRKLSALKTERIHK